jgi:hypothetical protein
MAAELKERGLCLLCGLVWGWIIATEYHRGGVITAFWKGLTGQ